MKTLYAKDPTTWLTSLKCSRVKEHIHLPCMFFKWYQSLKLTSEKRIYHNFNLNTLICLTAHNNDRGTVIIQVLFPRIFFTFGDRIQILNNRHMFTMATSCSQCGNDCALLCEDFCQTSNDFFVLRYNMTY